MTRVKICGLKTLEEARVALAAGADLVGFVFYRPVRRYVEPEQVATIVRACRADPALSVREWRAVGVFVDAPLAEVNAICRSCDLDLVQLCGDEDPEYCVQVERPAIRVLRAGTTAWTAERLQAAQRGYPVVARGQEDAGTRGRGDAERESPLSASPCLRVPASNPPASPRPGGVERFMVDSHVDGFYGGTGVAADWQSLAGLMGGKILAGGLRPDNVAAALAVTRPWGVDVSSGVEREGRKDPALIRAFIDEVRAFDRAR
ncbi:MAG: phosphoribosylanthranilate isomerase [Chloroflexi bacterium]|nr:phosphoribosylanthranilate isomerase [Chloroflexota bacterium]